jgi:hypothetical protein
MSKEKRAEQLKAMGIQESDIGKDIIEVFSFTLLLMHIFYIYFQGKSRP